MFNWWLNLVLKDRQQWAWTFFAETGLSLAQMIARAPIESSPEIDHWQKEYTYGKSLYNPMALSKLRTQMYILNK